MIKSFLRKIKKNNSSKTSVDTDSIPELPRNCIAAPLPIQGRANHSFNQNTPSTYSPSAAVASTSQHDQSSNLSAPTDSYLHTPNTQDYNGHSPSHTINSSPMAVVPGIQLTVSNSCGFHIGEVQNIHVSNGSVVNYNSPGSSLSSLEKSLNRLKPSSHSTLDSLVTNYDKIKDWEISLISEHAGDDWGALAQQLGLSKEQIEVVEDASEGDPKKAVLKILRDFVSDHPDTSVGFIASILHGIGSLKAVEHLAKLRS